MLSTRNAASEAGINTMDRNGGNTPPKGSLTELGLDCSVCDSSKFPLAAGPE
jgi:hypothetical protein